MSVNSGQPSNCLRGQFLYMRSGVLYWIFGDPVLIASLFFLSLYLQFLLVIKKLYPCIKSRSDKGQYLGKWFNLFSSLTVIYTLWLCVWERDYFFPIAFKNCFKRWHYYEIWIYISTDSKNKTSENSHALLKCFNFKAFFIQCNIRILAEIAYNAIAYKCMFDCI